MAFTGKWFDAKYYIEQNADVAAAWGGTAWEHYLAWGAAEGRTPNAWFDAQYYRANNADLAGLTAVELFQHYENHGYKEGRVPDSDYAKFDAAAYLTDYSDLGDNGITAETALNHYLTFGVKEGRTAKNTDGSTVSTTASGDSFTLTVNPNDVATANVFEAPQAWNPGGTALVQTLQTGDELTGSGTNPTLNAVLNAAAATPKLTDVETLNFETLAATAVTLSNSTGIKHINSVDSIAMPTITGVTEALVSVGMENTSSNMSISIANAALAGTSDELTINLDGVATAAALTVQPTAAGSGYETFNIVTSGNASRLATLTDGLGNSLSTIKVTGDKALRIDNALDATVKTFDASGMTEGGSARVTFAALAAGHDVTGSLGNDRITVSDLNTNDKFELGEGTDTLIAVDASNNNTINGLNTNITGVETLGVVSGAGGVNTVTFDSTKVADVTGVTLTNGDAAATADLFTATVNNAVLTSADGNGVTLTTPVTAGNAFGNVGITVKGADLSGTDHLTINIGSDSPTNATAFNTGVITANSIETLTFNVGDSAAHTLGGLTANALNTLNITGGSAGNNFTLTGTSVATNVDASSFAGALTLTGVTAGATAPTTQYVELGNGNDIFTFSGGTPGAAPAGANPLNIVTGGTGADTFIFAALSNTFGTAANLAGATAASQFDRIVDFDFGGVSTNATTGNDFLQINGGGTLARGSATIINDGQVTALSTTTYGSLQAALTAVVSTATVSKAGGGTATSVDHAGAANTLVAGLFSYDGATFLVAEEGLGAGAALDAYNAATANNYIIALTGVTGTLDAWDIELV